MENSKEIKHRNLRRGSQIRERKRKRDRAFMLYPFLDNIIAISPILSPSNQHRTVARNTVRSQAKQRMRFKTMQETHKQKLPHRRLKHLSLIGIAARYCSKKENGRFSHDLGGEPAIWDTKLPEIKQDEAISRLDIFNK